MIGLALTTSHDLCRGNEVLLNIFYEKSIEVVKKAWIDSTSGYHMLMEEIFLDGLALPASRDLSRRSISAGPFLDTLYPGFRTHQKVWMLHLHTQLYDKPITHRMEIFDLDD